MWDASPPFSFREKELHFSNKLDIDIDKCFIRRGVELLNYVRMWSASPHPSHSYSTES